MTIGELIDKIGNIEEMQRLINARTNSNKHYNPDNDEEILEGLRAEEIDIPIKPKTPWGE